MGNKTVEDFEADGFMVYSEKEKPPVAKVTPAPAAPTPPAKIIIMDNKDVLVALKESNKALKEGLETLVYSMQSKPEGFTLDIERDSRGFMKSIKVKVNK